MLLELEECPDKAEEVHDKAEEAELLADNRHRKTLLVVVGQLVVVVAEDWS